MASLRFIYNNRYVVFFWAVTECLIFSAIVYGWASMIYILKREKFFNDICHVDIPQGFKNGTRSSVENNGECVAQDNLLNLAFTVGVFTFTAFGVVAGTLLDHGGPRITRLAACISFGFTGVIFIFTDQDMPMMIFPGVMALTISGILLFVTMLQLSLLFGRWSSFASSFLNGGLDSSSVVLLFFKLIYSNGVSLKYIFGGYFILAVVCTGVFTFVLPSEPIEREEVEKLAAADEQHDDHEKPSEVSSEEESDFDSPDSLKKLFRQIDGNDHKLTKENDVKGSLREFFHIAISPMYILHVAFLSIHKLRLWFYMGSLVTYLQFAAERDKDSVNSYINMFGVVQFTGMLFSPIAGLVMDWQPKSIENKTFGFIIAFCMTNALDLLLNILVLIPVLKLQAISFIVQVALRAFLYSTYAGFIIYRFPMEHCGKLYGLGHFVGAVIGALQFYLFVIVHAHLQGDPFWINVGFLVVTLIIFVHPFYIWVVTERENEARKPHNLPYKKLKLNEDGME